MEAKEDSTSSGSKIGMTARTLLVTALAIVMAQVSWATDAFKDSASPTQNVRLTSAKDVVWLVMKEACAKRGVPDTFLVLDGVGTTGVSVVQCLQKRPDGTPANTGVTIDPCDTSVEATRIRGVMAETPELSLTVQCADPLHSGHVFPPGLRTAFDAMAKACSQRGSTLDHVMWTKSGRWVEALNCQKNSDRSYWQLNICDYAKDMHELRTKLSQRSEFPVSCRSGIPSEYAPQNGLGHCDDEPDGFRHCHDP
jgi:hypothetical protein